MVVVGCWKYISTVWWFTEAGVLGEDNGLTVEGWGGGIVKYLKKDWGNKNLKKAEMLGKVRDCINKERCDPLRSYEYLRSSFSRK